MYFFTVDDVRINFYSYKKKDAELCSFSVPIFFLVTYRCMYAIGNREHPYALSGGGQAKTVQFQYFPYSKSVKGEGMRDV